MARERREIEIKLKLNEAQLRRALVTRKLGPMTAKPPERNSLRSVYFDTSDYRLHKARMSLRLRGEGGEKLQTAKAETGVRGGLSEPIECECALHGDAPDIGALPVKSMRKRLEAVIGDHALKPVAETRIERTLRRVLVPDGSEIEVAVDNGEVLAGGRRAPIREAEIELKSGSVYRLLELVPVLIDRGPLIVATETKSDKGYRLLDAALAPMHLPQKAEPVCLAHDASISASIVCIVGAATWQIASNWAALLESEDPEGPHQLRVGLRRLRTALRALRRVHADKHLRNLEDRSKELARVVGQLRDIDALRADIVRPVQERLDGPHGIRALDALLERGRRRQLRVTRQALLERDAALLLIELTLLPMLLEERFASAQNDQLSQPVIPGNQLIDSCCAAAIPVWGGL